MGVFSRFVLFGVRKCTPLNVLLIGCSSEGGGGEDLLIKQDGKSQKNRMLTPRKKRVYTTTVAPLLSQSVARPRGHRAKKAIVSTISLGKQGKGVHTIGPEIRVYTIEASDPKKEKRSISTVVVFTVFLHVTDVNGG